MVEVRPDIADSLWFSLPMSARTAFGIIREGDYVDSLRVGDLVRDSSGSIEAMSLWAGHYALPSFPFARPGTYDVTLMVPGYVTWDTTGVTVDSDSSGYYIQETVHVSVQLEPRP
jgi:hypothetical protein